MAEKSKEPTVDVTLDLGDLKPDLKRAARDAGVPVNEFIVDAIRWRVGQDYYHERKEFTPHGGKHKMGKHCGYEVTEDGKYYPAATWVDQFDLLFAERTATYNLVNFIIAQSEERLKDIEKRIQATKKGLIEDLRLDPNKDWAYYGKDNYLVEQKSESTKPDGRKKR